MTIASAPGKILWLGGYSILEKPNISLVGAINKRVYAQIENNSEDFFEIESKQLNEKWRGNLESEKIESRLNFTYQALKCVKIYLENKGIEVKKVKIRTYSDEAFSINHGKSGLGSSAAVIVATVSALLEHYCKDSIKDKETIHKISQFAHSLAQGKIGSGFDVAVSCYGSCTYTRYDPKIIQEKSINDISKIVDENWDYQVKNMEFLQSFKIAVGNFSEDSTKTTSMVKKVMEFKKASPEKYFELIAKINEENLKTIRLIFELSKPKEMADYQKTMDEFVRRFDNTRILTKELGKLSDTEIESDLASELIEESKKNGAIVCKLPGSGGMDLIVAICKDNDARTKLEEFWTNYSNLKISPIQIENEKEGVRIEKHFKIS